MNKALLLDESAIQNAINALLDAAPGSRVVLFGSRARGDAKPDSDLDLLVVEPEVKDRFNEMVRLNTLLGQRLIPADVVVMSRDDFDHWRGVPNTLAYRVSREGVAYER